MEIILWVIGIIVAIQLLKPVMGYLFFAAVFLVAFGAMAFILSLAMPYALPIVTGLGALALIQAVIQDKIASKKAE